MFVPDGLLEELCQRLDEEGAGDWRRKLMQKEYGHLHLAVMAEPYLTRILQGEKTLESRLSRNRIPPYGRLDVGDVVPMKKTGGDIVALFEAAAVEYIVLGQQMELGQLQARYNRRLCCDEAFWKVKQDSRYATLIEIDHLQRIQPLRFAKKGRQTWLVLQSPGE